MLASLGVPKASEEPALEDAPVFEEPPEAPEPPPVETPAQTPAGMPTETSLSPEELALADQLRDESERVSREELPLMFEGQAGAGVRRSRAALGGVSYEGEASAEPGSRASPARGGAATFVDRALEVIDRPFRWVSPVWRMGLGLCGVLLLVTLLLVLLVRIVFGE